jgi:hypothetical protein
MGIDEFLANVRRKGYAGKAAQEAQEVDDYRAKNYHEMTEEALNKRAEQSHQEHKKVTGQVPDND